MAQKAEISPVIWKKEGNGKESETVSQLESKCTHTNIKSGCGQKTITKSTD